LVIGNWQFVIEERKNNASRERRDGKWQMASGGKLRLAWNEPPDVGCYAW